MTLTERNDAVTRWMWLAQANARDHCLPGLSYDERLSACYASLIESVDTLVGNVRRTKYIKDYISGNMIRAMIAESHKVCQSYSRGGQVVQKHRRVALCPDVLERTVANTRTDPYLRAMMLDQFRTLDSRERRAIVGRLFRRDTCEQLRQNICLYDRFGRRRPVLGMTATNFSRVLRGAYKKLSA